jgi:hypothetical protein
VTWVNACDSGDMNIHNTEVYISWFRRLSPTFSSSVLHVSNGQSSSYNRERERHRGRRGFASRNNALVEYGAVMLRLYEIAPTAPSHQCDRTSILFFF